MKPFYEESGIAIYHGDCLDVLPSIDVSVNAIVTDPPYSSGGAFRGDRTQKALTKYVRTESQSSYSDFSGDNRDQRAFLAWSSLWLTACHHLSDAGSVICCFSDWRQLPVLTDSIQCGGWVWRGLGTWWKPGCRMQRGRFSASAEYVIYGSKGIPRDGEKSPQNFFSCATMQTDDKNHIAEKPIEVMNWIIGVTTTDSVVLDPFCGSGTTLLAAKNSGRRAIGIEVDEGACEIAANRLRQGVLFGASSP